MAERAVLVLEGERVVVEQAQDPVERPAALAGVEGDQDAGGRIEGEAIPVDVGRPGGTVRLGQVEHEAALPPAVVLGTHHMGEEMGGGQFAVGREDGRPE